MGQLYELAVHRDQRGRLCVLDLAGGLPFAPRRQFTVTDVPAGAIRGQHANRKVDELLICLKGSVLVTLHDGIRSSSIKLDSPAVALHLPPMVWSEQRDFSADAVLLVLASLPYDSSDHISDFEAFVRIKQSSA